MNPVVIEEANSEGGCNLTLQRPNREFTATRVVDNNGDDRHRITAREFSVRPDITDHFANTDAHGEFSDGADVTDHIASTDTHESHDGADIMDHIAAIDADTFEILEQSAIEPTNHSGAVIPEQGPAVDLSASPPAPECQEQSITGAEMEPPLLTVDRFPFGRPGAVLIDDPPQDPCQASGSQGMSLGTIWAPFHSHCDWAIARWAKMRGPSSSAVTELLSIPGVVEKLGLSYQTANQLNNIIDHHLPGRPPFESNQVVIGNETLDFHCRDSDSIQVENDHAESIVRSIPEIGGGPYRLLLNQRDQAQLSSR
ncbi:hypothetical protein BC826DRAFT_1111107 [Russula brevipes]|nr:hypothetical protein BC826DRAFT_1111107 [Russula brevipes]